VITAAVAVLVAFFALLTVADALPGQSAAPGLVAPRRWRRWGASSPPRSPGWDQVGRFGRRSTGADHQLRGRAVPGW